MEQRWNEIRGIHTSYTLFYRVSLVGIGILIGWLLFADKQAYLTNVFTEAIGVIGTFFVLDWWTRRRDNERDEYQLRQRLIIQMRSRDNAIALQALEEIRL